MAPIRDVRPLKDIEAERDTIVQELLGCCTPSDGGYTVTGVTAINKQMQCEAILGYELMIREGFEKRFDELRYGFQFGNSPLGDPVLDLVVRALIGKQNATFPDCVKVLEDKIPEIEQMPVSQFHVHMVLNAVPDSDFSPLSLSVSDAQVQIRHISELSPVLQNEAVIDEIEHIQEIVGFPYLSDNRLVLSVSLKARNKFYAAKVAQQLKDFTLGLIDLANHHHSNPLTIIGVPSPIDTIDAPLIFILDDAGEYQGAFYTDEKSKDSQCSINHQFLAAAMAKYSSASPDVQELLRQAFSAYHRGIIEKDPALAFSSFWLCMEKILLKTRSVPHAIMINRFFWLMRDQKVIIEFELAQLLELRNALLHDAMYHRIGQYQRNLLKAYVDAALGLFLFEISQLDKGQIELFYKKFKCKPREYNRTHPVRETPVYALIKKLREEVA